jgi:hypothetical protein
MDRKPTMKQFDNYSNLHNEGGEGYNPHNRRAVSSEPEWSVLSGQIDRLRRMQESISPTGNPRRYAEMETEIERLIPLYNAAMAAGKNSNPHTAERRAKK